MIVTDNIPEDLGTYTPLSAQDGAAVEGVSVVAGPVQGGAARPPEPRRGRRPSRPRTPAPGRRGPLPAGALPRPAVCRHDAGQWINV